MYMPNFLKTAGFYYSPYDLGEAYTGAQDTGCAEGNKVVYPPQGISTVFCYKAGTCHVEPGCQLPVSTTYTLNFFDRPGNGSCSPQMDCLAFTTQLVGICGPQASSPLCNPLNSSSSTTPFASLPLYQWNWKSNFKSPPLGSTSPGSGGIYDVNVVSEAFQSLPDGGTGGVTITDINGVQLSTSTPTVVNLAPAVSVSSTQLLNVNYYAPAGYQTLGVLNVLINSALDGRHACYIAYVPSGATSGQLLLVDDAGDAGGPFSTAMLPGSGTVQNSQCTVSGSASGIGNNLSLVLNVTFANSFAGNKVVYAAARDLSQNSSGWQAIGVHGVPPLPSTLPNPVGLTPTSGNSLGQTITFSYQDQSDARNVQTVWALINTALDGRGGCYIAYYRPGNLVLLFPDNGDGSKAISMVLNGNNTISNSQCSVSAQGASVQTNGSILSVTLPITFNTGFAGFKGVWLAAYTVSGAVSAWQALGARHVPAN
jgi:hypothetical protein